MTAFVGIVEITLLEVPVNDALFHPKQARNQK